MDGWADVCVFPFQLFQSAAVHSIDRYRTYIVKRLINQTQYYNTNNSIYGLLYGRYSPFIYGRAFEVIVKVSIFQSASLSL